MPALKHKLDRGTIIILVVFLILASAAGLVAYQWSRNFFATTALLNVEDAPPISIQTPTPKGLVAGAVGTKSAAIPTLSAASDVKVAKWDGVSRVTVLVMGLDYRDWQSGADIPRTDTMMLLTIDPLTKTAGMISIPRDMWVNIPGFGYSRINAAYRTGEMYKLPGGGIGLASKTVENFLGVPVDYVALLDFNSVVRFIDALGGLDMYIRDDIKVDPIGPGNTIVLHPGVQTLDGQAVLAYARNRYTNDGDFDRARRQQEVIMALRDQIVQFNQLPTLVANAPKLYEELSSGIRTTLTLDQAIQLAWLAVQIDPANIKKGVFDPHKDVGYANVATSDGDASVLVPNPDQIRLLRDEIFSTGGSYGPVATGSTAELMKTENARVVFKNGTGSAERAQQAAQLLRDAGMQIVGEQGADRAYSATTIIDYTGKPYTSKFIQETIKVADLRVENKYDPNAPSDIEVILGSDWAGQ